MSFESYTDCVLRAFCSHPKPAEIVKRKHEIILGVSEYHNYTPESILYIGFNPAIMIDQTPEISVTYISKAAQDHLNSNGIKFNVIDPNKLSSYNKQFDVVVAMDEYFTFSDSDHDQKDQVTKICNLAKEFIITTCKDYKNQDFKDREFSIPALIRNQTQNKIYFEFHDHDLTDRNSWKTTVHEIADNKLNTNGPYARRAMFFKQLAKFSADADAVGFSVHKNLMYKSLIKKNYEHVISIRFDNNGS